jgi:DNA-binding MarR family transcriptional regulator
MISRETSFGYKISQLHRLIQLHTAATFEPLGLGAYQVPFVAELFREEGQTQDQLSARLHIDKAATARTLAKLEQRGLVVRRVNSANRRQKLIYLTEQTRRLQEEFLAPLLRVTEILSQGFSEEERGQALRLLDRMVSNACRAVRGEA